MTHAEPQPEAAPFRLPSLTDGTFGRALWAVAQPALERALALPALNALYADLPRVGDPRHFCDKALDMLEVRCDVAPGDLARIPCHGPLIVVANHPFGGLDGLVLASILRRVRPDVKLLANHLLQVIPDLRDLLIFVDPFGGDGAQARNTGALKAARRWLAGGGALGMFPAGEVAHWRVSRADVTDPDWSPTVGRLVQSSGAPVLPVFFEGGNSLLFHMLGLIHPRLRTLLLPRELLRRRRSIVSVRVGRPVAPHKVASFADPATLTRYLRARCFVLGADGAARARRRAAVTSAAASRAALLPGPPSDVLAEEVNALGPDRLLVESGACRVLLTTAAEIPRVLVEIGRLRELTFRAVGEGTGASRDLDRFDQHYEHLFVWNDEAREVMGGYRIGRTDRILPERGPSGLYSASLFRYDARLLRHLTPALELGRSFVRPEYQRDYTPLMLLWKGIGALAAREPRYRRLFGLVSISNDYREVSRQLLSSFLELTRLAPELSHLIRARNPPRFPSGRGGAWARTAAALCDVGDVDDLVEEIEAGEKGVPVLLRQYLKLNAVLLGFNVDPGFGNALDSLMLVDLTAVPRNVLARYMGSEGAARFLAFHRSKESAECAGGLT